MDYEGKVVDRPFANTDAKRQAQTLASRVGDAREPMTEREFLRPTAEILQRLGTLVNYVENETNAIREIGYKMRSHTDALFGEEPKAPSTADARPSLLPPMPPSQGGGELGCIHGMLATMETALLTLSEAHSFVAYQAGRATSFV